MVVAAPNPRPALDAAIPFCLNIGSQRRGTSEAERSMSE
jgi:hypothetical protein